jgi:hypothetical protein
VPFVLAYAKRALIEAREEIEKVEHRKQQPCGQVARQELKKETHRYMFERFNVETFKRSKSGKCLQGMNSRAILDMHHRLFVFG